MTPVNRNGRNRRAHEGAFQGETPGIFIVLSGFATSDLSVDFCDARQGGRSLWKNASSAAFYRFCLCWLLLTCSFLRYPLILWITVLPPLSELIPLAAAERPSVSESVSEEAEERLMLHFLLTHLCGISHPHMAHFSVQSALMPHG
ncbi:hypothetical protein [Escherichia coli]|uniref:hypothetical protein n=1 Tax=Escherichia coli TaxID=562 RepID=UPI001FCD7FDF|nr:hypothetical protein [Escherichia coli]